MMSGPKIWRHRGCGADGGVVERRIRVRRHRIGGRKEIDRIARGVSVLSVPARRIGRRW